MYDKRLIDKFLTICEQAVNMEDTGLGMALIKGSLETMKIPEREEWLYENPEALEALEKGIESAKTKPLVDRGSFAEYVDEEDEDV